MESMKDLFTEIYVNLVDDEKGVVKANVNVTIIGMYKCNGFKVLNTNRGLVVTMPNIKKKEKNQDGKPLYKDVFHPITKEGEEFLKELILEKYNYIKNKIN